MSKMTIQLQITAIVELDGGYYRNDNMDKIEELLQQKIHSMQILVKEGATEPKPVRGARIKLHQITYQPGD